MENNNSKFVLSTFQEVSVDAYYIGWYGQGWHLFRKETEVDGYLIPTHSPWEKNDWTNIPVKVKPDDEVYLIYGNKNYNWYKDNFSWFEFWDQIEPNISHCGCWDCKKMRGEN